MFRLILLAKYLQSQPRHENIPIKETSMKTDVGWVVIALFGMACSAVTMLVFITLFVSGIINATP